MEAKPLEIEALERALKTGAVDRLAAAAHALPAPRARHHAQGQRLPRSHPADLADPRVHGGGDPHRPGLLHAHAGLESAGQLSGEAIWTNNTRTNGENVSRAARRSWQALPY